MWRYDVLLLLHLLGMTSTFKYTQTRWQQQMVFFSFFLVPAPVVRARARRAWATCQLVYNNRSHVRVTLTARSTIISWKILRHNGIAFPPDYKPLGLTIRIKNQIAKLDPLSEEMLMAWAKKIGTPYVDDPVFQENFMLSLRQHAPEWFGNATIRDIDFSELFERAQREKLANLAEAERKRVSAERKQLREELKAKYGHARVDEHEVEIGAYLVEPPGIFMGRGAHPLRGRWKPRVYSYEVTLNLDEDAPTPPAPHKPEGEDQPRWAAVVHEHDSLWVARWNETLTDKIKYVWLAETSHLRQEREKEKYEKAKSLEQKLNEVREAIRAGMRDRHEKKRKVATVAYLIDRLAMRVGDEKDEDEADTVGASTLRVEHVKIGEDKIDFDFLGKDSVRWEKSLEIRGDDRVLARNLREFTAGKQPGDQIFPEITSAQVNNFLRSVMPGLTAKVFRTYHATTTVQDFLKQQGRGKNGASPYAQEHIARLANLEAAIKCNHKRTPPKNWAENLEKRAELVDKLRAAKPDLAKLDADVAARQAALEKLVAEQNEFEGKARGLLSKKREARAALEAKPAPADGAALTAYNKRLRAARRTLKDAEQSYKTRVKRFKSRIAQAHMALDKAQTARQHADTNYRERVEKAELALELARRTRDYNLNTSLKNYIDPRVYREWGARSGFDWTKLYTTSLKRKFQWAIQEHDEDGTDGDADQE